VSSASPVNTGIFDELIIEGKMATLATGKCLPGATAAFEARQDALTVILAPAWVQWGWLRDTGFVDVDVLMKSFEIAVIVARRPES
jgi:hypothetical protein